MLWKGNHCQLPKANSYESTLAASCFVSSGYQSGHKIRRCRKDVTYLGLMSIQCQDVSGHLFNYQLRSLINRLIPLFCALLYKLSPQHSSVDEEIKLQLSEALTQQVMKKSGRTEEEYVENTLNQYYATVLEAPKFIFFQIRCKMQVSACCDHCQPLKSQVYSQ